MDILVLRAAAGSAAERKRIAVPEGATWARFGDQLVLAGSGAAFQRHRAAVAPAAARVVATPGLTRDRLHVVVQMGRTFQQHHPDVPVLHDRGRYLLVDLPPARARKIGKQHPACYALHPLGAGEVVFSRGGAVAAAARVGRIAKLVDAVSRERFLADLTRLAGMPTRLSRSKGFRDALARAALDLGALGYATRKQRIRVGKDTSSNLIADRPGSGPAPRPRVYVTAHLDSINHEDGPDGDAPGADDNGSGSAGLLEMARVLAAAPTKHDLRFVLFGGEEQGLYGSTHLVAKLAAAERKRIRAVVNMDMIASTNTAQRTVLLEGAPASSAVIDQLESAARTYTTLDVERSLHASNSDHVPFLDAGIPAVLTIEGADSSNARVHSARDTLAHVDVDLAVAILRMNVAFTAAAAGVG